MLVSLLFNGRDNAVAIKIKCIEQSVWFGILLSEPVRETCIRALRSVKQIRARELELWNKNDSFVSSVISSVSLRLPRAFSPAHPNSRSRRRTFLLTCSLTYRARRSVHLTANVISPSPLLLLNDLAIVVSLLWHANHPRSLLRRAAEWTTQIKNFYFVFDTVRPSLTVIAKNFYSRLAQKISLSLQQLRENVNA